MIKNSDVNNMVFGALINSKNGSTFRDIFILTNEKIKAVNRPPKRMAVFKWFRYFIYRIVNKLRIKLALIELVKVGLVVSGENKYTLSEVSKNIFISKKDPTKITKEDQEMLLTWIYDIGDKQYRSYSWNDSKVQSLLTVDAALIAGILFIFQIVSEKINIEGIPLLFFALSFILLSASLIYCLLHSIPKLDSKIGNESNLRTIIGINRFTIIAEALGKSNFIAREKYYESVIGLRIEDILKMNITQIAGMSKNNHTSHKIIREGVICTIVSILLILIAMILLAFQTTAIMQLIKSIFDIFRR